MTANWETGTIVKFDHDRGFGFITPDDGDEDLFMHVNDVTFEKAAARPGVGVKFRSEKAERGRKATQVELIIAEGGDGMVEERQFLAEITELLLSCSSELSSRQIVEIRGQLLRYADHHGWIN